MSSQRIKIASLWSKEIKTGQTVLSGYFGDADIEIWPNGYKTQDNHPDWIMYVKPKYKKEKEDGNAVQFQAADSIPF